MTCGAGFLAAQGRLEARTTIYLLSAPKLSLTSHRQFGGGANVLPKQR